VSVNSASAEFHWFGRSQLIRTDPSKGFSGAMAGKEAARGYRDKFLGLLAFGNVLATTSAVFAQASRAATTTSIAPSPVVLALRVVVNKDLMLR
jgi:hypothetical protein